LELSALSTGCSVVRDQAKFIRDWDRCISILPLKVFVPYSIFMKKTTCPMLNFNENNIENKTNKALRFLIEGRRRKCDRV
jgi:hypothetical protein